VNRKEKKAMISLGSKYGNLRMANYLWREILNLAHEYGWNPKGTKAPSLYYGDDSTPAACPNWDGSYFENSYQLVEADDSANIAEALERALPHTHDYLFNDGTGYRALLQKFIDLCRAGSFHIG
jgi:hypothetical protein